MQGHKHLAPSHDTPHTPHHITHTSHCHTTLQSLHFTSASHDPMACIPTQHDQHILGEWLCLWDAHPRDLRQRERVQCRDLLPVHPAALRPAHRTCVPHWPPSHAMLHTALRYMTLTHSDVNRTQQGHIKTTADLYICSPRSHSTITSYMQPWEPQYDQLLKNASAPMNFCTMKVFSIIKLQTGRHSASLPSWAAHVLLMCILQWNEDWQTRLRSPRLMWPSKSCGNLEPLAACLLVSAVACPFILGCHILGCHSVI